MRRQSGALGAAGRDRSRRAQRRGADRAARPDAVPADRRSALSADARRLRLLLVSPEPRRRSAHWHDERLPREDAAGARAHRLLDELLPRARRALARGGGDAAARAARGARAAAPSSRAQRWYAGKGAPISRASRLAGSSANGKPRSAQVDARARSTSRAPSSTTQYFMPLAIAFEDAPESRWQKLQPFAIARVRQQAAVGVLADAGCRRDFGRAVVEAIGAGGELRTEHGTLALRAHGGLSRSCAAIRTRISAAAAPLTQGSNTAVRLRRSAVPQDLSPAAGPA